MNKPSGICGTGAKGLILCHQSPQIRKELTAEKKLLQRRVLTVLKLPKFSERFKFYVFQEA